MSVLDPTARRVPPLGGFNVTVLTIELRRLLRNRRTIIFTLIMPVLLYLIIGSNASYANDREGSGNVSAYILISMAAYGAVLAATSGGAMVANERALGWSRQLRLTPLSPVAYILTKALVSLLLGLASVLAVNVVGVINGKAEMPTHVWIAAGLIAWLGSIVFSAFGLFMGYLLPSENVMQVLGPVLAGLAALGGLWFPIEPGTVLGHISACTPIYGLAYLARWPLYGGAPHLVWVLNLLFWLVVFVGGAAWRMSKDTARV
ncbi:ABC transporter permease [Nocardioides marmoriginsengisoli]|uniref:ABC transporter permease n=1 Tax=Nocardioides marmoriginsengisoli TaxID=661483 RepID=A0A3N0CJN6_9ACTN|nr:ABC transporter permease [Nocardioides marmoriginsengisoli]RNL63678.1 ABC transporter permease [Nocardioides marmoriginsengisoli]